MELKNMEAFLNKREFIRQQTKKKLKKPSAYSNSNLYLVVAELEH